MIIREANVVDAEGIARVHVDCWRTTYKDIIPEEFLNNLFYENRTKIWAQNISNEHNYVFVAERDGKIVGFTDAGKEMSGQYPGYLADITTLYILKEFQGLGIAKQLLQQVFMKLKENNMTSALVWVLEDNLSRHFYEAMGANVIEKQKDITIGGKQLNLMGYGWRNI
ncbi:N-acetyltransferase family protein [Paenisporosarcina sp. NPDC076898]|uniref:GNAT family N-acetyltransferase n=1 Tax=unclassified Paenisporosarcina TaxID=2642018 RepID=UPI003CFF32DC